MKLFPLGRASLAAMALTAALAAAAPAGPAAEVEAAYLATITARAEKIVVSLAIADSAKAIRVRDIIARQYRDLRDVQEARDAQIKAAKAGMADKAALDAATKSARAEADVKVGTLHPAFLARLGAELDTGQIEQVKDGMTFGVLPLTFRVYQEMLPKLTAEQKAQIHAWLVEAREHAMDGFSSEEKHA